MTIETEVHGGCQRSTARATTDIVLRESPPALGLMHVSWMSAKKTEETAVSSAKVVCVTPMKMNRCVTGAPHLLRRTVATCGRVKVKCWVLTQHVTNKRSLLITKVQMELGWIIWYGMVGVNIGLYWLGTGTRMQASVKSGMGWDGMG